MSVRITEPFLFAQHNLNRTGDSAQIREKYTALCPVPEIRSTLESIDSLSTIPTSPRACGHVRQASPKVSASENNPLAGALLTTSRSFRQFARHGTRHLSSIYLSTR